MLRTLIVLAILAVAAYALYRVIVHARTPTIGASIPVYYCKTDGETMVKWDVSLAAARDLHSVAFYAATQAVAGPPSGTDAIRFPAGTVVRGVDVSGTTAVVDLSGAVASGGEGGSFGESGEFKALVWTLTALPGISSVQVRVDGRTMSTLPGGHLELDQPLTRSSW